VSSPTTPDLVVAAALAIEARALRRGAPGMRIVRSGIGPDRARKAAARLRRDPARAVAVAGVCGALAPELRPGQLLVAHELCHADGRIALGSAEPLRAILAEQGLEARSACLFSSDHLVRSRERTALRAGGAEAVDMESAWLADGAAGRPLAVLRVVVDSPGHEIFTLSLLRHGLRALARLRAAAPALEIWASRCTRAG